MAASASTSHEAPVRPFAYNRPRVHIDRKDDGRIYLKSEKELIAPAAPLSDRLLHWATQTPDNIFIAERSASGGWRKISYKEALAAARAIGQSLLGRGLGPERPVLILSGNSVDHALVTLGCIYAGIPWCPVSPAYSLISKDFGKLRQSIEKLTPGLIFVDDAARFASALEVCSLGNCELATGCNPPNSRTLLLSDLLATKPLQDIEDANAAIRADSIVKFLLTSGSTGNPKAVINTQGMWCANLAQIGETLAVLHDEPPVLLDWLPWNHTFGGNHNFGIALYFGGALYIDDGRPTPAGIAATVRNLREIAPTAYFNVPKGFESLVPHLRADPALRKNFYANLQFTFFAGAGIAQHVWDALDELSIQETGLRVPMLTGLGATETAPSCLFTWPGESRASWLGLPISGIELKLAPSGDRYEARVRGPNITPGYWRDPALSAAAFDEEGFYRFGDAVRFVDETDPQGGLLFDGRIAEDFKLATGTWVKVGPLRSDVIRACAPLVRDVVIAGINRDFLVALLILDEDACRSQFGAQPLDALETNVELLSCLRASLARSSAKATGSSNRILRARVLRVPLSLDRGEVTDKGSVNQRAVLQCRATEIEELYGDHLPAEIINLAAEAR